MADEPAHDLPYGTQYAWIVPWINLVTIPIEFWDRLHKLEDIERATVAVDLFKASSYRAFPNLSDAGVRVARHDNHIAEMHVIV
ncbi:hypothetical protein [Mesorhizobium sp.]|uniref:hypothetical protein n=1 Tax=Mesorhizobium sp. TaxID=1871066 RepID=UPI00257F48D0|nr:hypothetical protein [Mesorhizobium sp.]